jgi:hypothetical protein
MNSHAPAIWSLGNVLTVMYGALAGLELAMVVLFPTQTPGYFAPLSVLHGATATTSWWWAVSDGGPR